MNMLPELLTFVSLLFVTQMSGTEFRSTLMVTPNVSIVYPISSEKYFPNTVEKWIFNYKTPLNFSIRIKHLDLEKSNNCKADFLQIYDGIRYIAKTFCGEQSAYTNSSHYEFFTYIVVVTFSSDRSWQGTGFTLEITGYLPNMDKLCESLHGPNYTAITSSTIWNENIYPAMLNCSWYISTSSLLEIFVDFEFFDIEYSGPECPIDRLEISEVSDQSESKLIEAFCGHHKPWLINTKSNSIRIRFITDAVDNIGKFFLYYGFTKVAKGNDAMYKLQATEVFISRPVSSLLQDIPSNLIWQIRTQPGFRVNARIAGGLVGGVVIMYDGPGVNYEILEMNNPNYDARSSGFYLTIAVDLSTQYVNIATNLSFEASNSFHRNTTEVMFNGENSFLLPTARLSKHVLHIALIVPPNRYARFNIKPVVTTFMRDGGNTNECGTNGIAFYDGSVSYDNMIGPFCDIDKDYTRSVLRKMVMSTSVAYLVLYGYYLDSRIDSLFVSSTHETCRGFQITGRMFETARFIDEDLFILQATTHDKTRSIHISYTESTDDCVVVHLLPYQTNLTDILIQLTGHFTYRICRQWVLGLQTYVDNLVHGSKYDSSENCTKYSVSTKQTTELQESIETFSGFNKEVIVLELGPVSENLCIDIVCLPNQENHITVSCGMMTDISIRNGCRMKITGPSQKESSKYIWVVKLDYLKGARDEEVFMVIFERYNDTREDVKTVISYHSIGQMRTFSYFSLPRADLYISTHGAHRIDFRFFQQTLNTTSMETHNDTHHGFTCIMYKGHCYRLFPPSVSVTWQSSRLQCQRTGGYLVSINTADELNFLKRSLETWWESAFYGNGRGLIFIGLSDTIQTGSYRWEDGGLLTVSDWYYPFANFDNVLPETPQPPIDLAKIQPVFDSSQRCVAMVPGNPRFSTNWRKVSCGNVTVSHNVYSICETENTSESRNQKVTSLEDSNAFTTGIQCPGGWNFVQGICLRLATTPSGLLKTMSEDKAKSICNDMYNGIVARAENIPREVLRKHLISMLFSGGDIWVTLTSGILGCISLPILSTEKLHKERLALKTDTCQPTGGNVIHVLCETSPIETPHRCRPFQFRCDDGTCLTPDRICDHHPDCLSSEDEFSCLPEKSTFPCLSGESISIFRYCDFNVDCADGSDEIQCVHENCSQSEYRCTIGQCVPLESRCDHKFGCLDKSDEHLCNWEIDCKSFKCPILGCIPIAEIEDLKPDCPDSTEADELINIRDHKRIVFFIKEKYNIITKVSNFEAECPSSYDHQRCHQDYITCFPRHKTCLYDHGIYNQLLFCSNGAHLRYCEDFECPDKFKCPASFCIPHHKVCDGVRDCVKGEDEMDCGNRTCPDQLKCGRSDQCVSLDYVCDGIVHCRTGIDDEMFCNIETFDCPSNCTCHGLSVTCVQGFRNIPQINITAELRVLDFSHNKVKVTNRSFHSHRYLAYLYLNNNTISSLAERVFLFLSNLLLLDLSDNLLSVLEPETFLGLHQLHTLRLNGNPLHRISPRSFVGLSVLSELNLSGMYIDVIENNSFVGLSELAVLNLSNNFIKYIDEETVSSLSQLSALWLTNNDLDETKADLLKYLNVKTLHTDSYVFCCNVGFQTTECSPELNSYTSCSDLLHSEVLQAVVWTFSALALIGNVGVIFWRLFINKVHNVSSIFVLNLGAADLLMGIYLLSLSVANIHYKGVYTLNDKLWRQSKACIVIGIISTVSCEMSMFTLVCIAADRTKRLAFPFTAYQFNKKSAKITMVLGWVFCLFIGIIPLSARSYFGDYYSRNSVCLPFNFADPFGKGWEFSLLIFVVLNALGIILVVIMYGVTYLKVKETQQRAGREDRMDLDVARKLTIIIVTDICCVIPLTMTNLLSVLGEPINRDMASVLTTVILPINSALNPYIFTFSTFKLNRKK